MTETTTAELQPGDRIRLRRLPRTHQHLTGKYGRVVERPSDVTAAVVLEGRRDALLVHVGQAVLVSRPEHRHTWTETDNPCGTCLGTEHAALYCAGCDRLVCLAHEDDPRDEESSDE
jgi:hypothetical protein